MTVWPSVAGMRLLGIPVGKILGRLLNIKAGFYIFTVGNLLALLAIPVGIVLYMKRVGPFVATRYRVTNKRIVVERGLTAVEERSISFDRFDNIQIEVGPGDAWFKSGDLVFRQGDVERFRLEGVSRPESFRQVCMKSHQAYVGVQAALGA
jgi:membrane protein YdbS with pleckstrin-like domain